MTRMRLLPCWVLLRRHRWVETSHEYWVRRMCARCGAWKLLPHSALYWAEHDKAIAALDDDDQFKGAE